MAELSYKQATITMQTSRNIEAIKDELAKRGTPMQSPAIIGMAVNELLEKMVANG